MKYTTLTRAALVISTLVVIAACGSSGNGTEGEVAPEPTQTPAATLPPPSQPTATSTAPTPPPKKACTSSCKSDSECATTCPVSAGATPCCDLKTNTCYNTASASCPKPEADAGPDKPAY